MAVCKGFRLLIFSQRFIALERRRIVLLANFHLLGGLITCILGVVMLIIKSVPLQRILLSVLPVLVMILTSSLTISTH